MGPTAYQVQVSEENGPEPAQSNSAAIRGALCCNHSKDNQMCHDVCEQIFSSKSESRLKHLLQRAPDYCPETMWAQFVAVMQAITQTAENTVKPSFGQTLLLVHLRSKQAEDHACQNACKRILMSKKTEMEIVDGLIEGCKTQPLPQDPLWQCFLESSQSVHPGVTLHPPPSTGLDGAKLHCCSKANTSTCRELCTKLYSMSWGNTQSWQEFDRFCEYNPVEVSMLTCLADVREPCQLGCRNLTYCTNFNNRPTELFRSCNAQSDQGAMNDMKLWEKGSIKMPFINIPVLDIKKCQPEMWKAVACSLQIKPCHSKSRGSIICKSDCVEILKKCGDQNKFPEDHTAESICELLSPTDDLENCIPLDTYLRPSTLGNIVEEVTHPCNPNPCPANELCEVNRKGCPSGDPCLPFSCVQGCKLGEASDFIVRQGTLIQVPSSAGEVGCYKICSCGQSGLLENCMEMHCIDLQKSCIVGGKRKSLPCNCADQFVPVCGQNGRTYPSACLARCVGLQDHQFEFGSCISKDPCNPNPCPKNQRCLKFPKKTHNCMHSNFKSCQKRKVINAQCRNERAEKSKEELSSPNPPRKFRN
ncbi:hypothetical protein GH733_011415 [Mirounga leonina]|nr:hypothetical protein GH733_011415 [Mirounga leonina]